MPTYVFRCQQDHAVEAYRPVDRRDDPLSCPVDGTPVTRIYAPPAVIVRPAGYSLHPGDRGYWNLTGLQRPAPAPLAQAEELYARPPQPVDPSTPVEE